MLRNVALTLSKFPKQPAFSCSMSAMEKTQQRVKSLQS